MSKSGAPKVNTFKDKSYTVRLNEGRPNERQAITVIENYMEQGYTPRQIVVMGLLALSGKPVVAGEDQLSELVDQFGGTLDELRGVIELLRETGLTPAARKTTKEKTSNAPPGYIATLKNALHLGED